MAISMLDQMLFKLSCGHDVVLGRMSNVERWVCETCGKTTDLTVEPFIQISVLIPRRECRPPNRRSRTYQPHCHDPGFCISPSRGWSSVACHIGTAPPDFSPLKAPSGKPSSRVGGSPC